MSAAAASTRSQLSRTSSSRLGARKLDSVSRRGWPATSRTPRAAAMVGTTRSGSVSGERSTKTTPSGKASPISTATAIASRVLPVPPAPVKVTNRTSSRCRIARRASISASRPMRRVKGIGTERSAGLTRSAAPRRKMAGRAAASNAARASCSDLQGVGQHAHGFQPRGGTGAALQVADAAHAEAGSARPAPPETATPRCATGEVDHRKMLGSQALAASSPSRCRRSGIAAEEWRKRSRPSEHNSGSMGSVMRGRRG